MYYLRTKEYAHIAGDINALYHEAACRMGLSDTVMNILYIICENDDSCLQSEISKSTGISRKTINSALQKMKQEGLLEIQQGSGRNTVIALTDVGKALVKEKMYPIFEMERKIWNDWSKEEQVQYLKLTEKYRDGLKKYLPEML